MTPGAFLDAVAPGGPWLITAIAAGAAPCSTLATAPGDVDALAAIHAGADLYWTPAALRRAPAGKPSKADVAGSWWQWCDVDPPAGADRDAWRADALPRLQAAAPTVVIDSGRGFWGLWQRPTFSTDVAEIEGVNKALADALGGDNCWNVDRLARLPGTMNSKTGRTATVIAWTPGPAALPAPKATTATQSGEWTDHGTDPAGDDDLIARALAEAVPPFGNRVPFAALWDADADALADRWPARNADDPFDHSEADLSLASRLMRLTGGDCARTERLMRRSALVRPKWDKHRTYLRDTILKAVDPAKRRAAQLAEARAIGETPNNAPLPSIMTLEEMIDGLIYVGATRAVVHRPTGRLRTWEAATGDYAGSRHKYTDDEGKDHNVAALTAWRAHPARMTVDVVAWRPDQPELCEPPEALGGNTRAVNLWRGLRPLPVPENWQEWAAVFTRHVGFLVPDPAQRESHLDWLAHIVQRPGELPHTCYVMIARETGIGRNWLGGVLARVLPGHVAVGVSLPKLLDGGFNGRLSQKLLATVDETREGMSANRHQRGEALKRLITEESRLIDPKYGHQVVEQNACRWLMFSNHDDAVPIDNNDRRVIVIENPTERASPEYYASIYANLARPELAGSVRHMLETRDLSAFNPGAHAPMSEAKRRTIQSMESGVDRAVRAFRETWPGPVAGRSDVRRFVLEDTGAQPNEAALGYAMERAGIVQSSRRIRIGMLRDRVIGLGISIEEIKQYDAPTLAAAIQDARGKFDAL